ncbi:MAG: branched-chain amino acid ABC transporter permease [Nitrospirae bacterium]|nr:branched-chain amino acid ABC transporter permease [Nitrospirota bacterium]
MNWQEVLDRSSLFLLQLTNGLTLGSIYALIAVGYTMVYGVLELINFAHGEVYMMGAFIAYHLVSVYDVPFFAAFAIALVICSAFGIFLEYFAYRPLRDARRLVALISAIGMSIFLQNLALIIWGAQQKSFPYKKLPSLFSSMAFTLGDINLSYLQVFIFLLSVVLMFVLHYIIRHTKTGMAMRAIAQDAKAASLMGINLNRVISFTFAAGSFLGAVAGVLVGVYYNAIWPTMGYMAGIKAFAAAVLGGIGSVPGAILGGTILGVAEAFGAGYISSAYRDGIAYAIMILVLIFKPAGLLGKSVVQRR